jgi:hypothetical protein
LSENPPRLFSARPHGEPRVRIHLPPAASLLRTLTSSWRLSRSTSAQGLKHLQAWGERIGSRPGVQKGTKLETCPCRVTRVQMSPDPWVEHSADNQLSESIQPEQRLSAGAAARRACRAGDVRDTSAAAGPGSASGQRSLVLRPCATRPQRAGDRWRDRAHCRGDPHGNRTVRWAAIAPSG